MSQRGAGIVRELDQEAERTRRHTVELLPFLQQPMPLRLREQQLRSWSGPSFEASPTSPGGTGRCRRSHECSAAAKNRNLVQPVELGVWSETLSAEMPGPLARYCGRTQRPCRLGTRAEPASPVRSTLPGK